MTQTRALSGPTRSGRTVRLRGNVHLNAQAQFDVGAVDGSVRVGPVTLLLKKTAAQEADLNRLLVDQQDPFSPNYHHWLTPEEYAERFGVQPDELNKVTAWLESEGFTIADVSRGRNWVTFDGTARQIETALRTRMRTYRFRGKPHLANATEPSVPEEIESLVEAIAGLDDFRLKAANTRWKVVERAGDGDLRAQATYGSSHYLAPDDFAAIFNIAPLYSMGVDGTGQKIVVAGQTELDPGDIRNFRSRFNLPPNDPQLILPAGDRTPGMNDDIFEANLDVQWAGAVAPNASILYVYSTDVIRSVQYAVSQNLAPVISFSYVLCENNASPAVQASLRAIAQQANVQGITWVAASGDSGSAACDMHNRDPVAKGGMGVTLPASLPEVTGIGGTQFSAGNGSYWSSTNTPTGASALGYIPETAWNESSESNGLMATGGGLSAIFGKPAWQTGFGVHTINARGVPDVSFPASTRDGYLIVSGGRLLVTGGTSAGTPAFAGVVALLNQYGLANHIQTAQGQGNLNPALYRMAQSIPGAFHDIATGNNIVPCSWGWACSSGSFGHSAGPGYDLVTGLGTVAGFTFVTGGSIRMVNTTLSLDTSFATLNANSSTLLTATVTAAASAAIPHGTVTFYAGNISLGAEPLVNSGGKATASINVSGKQLAGGSNVITAQYSGAPGFNASTASAAVTVVVQMASIVISITPNPVIQRRADADGFSWFYTITLTEVGGAAASLTDFSINGVSAAAHITALFGASSIPSGGKLSATLKAKDLSVPATLSFHFGGTDAGGRQWSQDVSVPFYGPPKDYATQPICSPYSSAIAAEGRGCAADQPTVE
ncbi:MAG: Ig-like domain repeat protein [Acidobacteria bacterium]|nr:Ig-like domain repeat protein [Acidobacteriota bacterium]